MAAGYPTGAVVDTATADTSDPRVLADLLAARLTEVLGQPAGVADLRRLTGGASRETWAFTALPGQGAPRRLVLRRDPPGPGRPEGMAVEARVLAVAARAGVAVPPLVDAGTDPAVVGSPYLIMGHVDGETIARKLLRDPQYERARAGLAAELGRTLARIHAIAPEAVPGLAASGCLGASAPAAGAAPGTAAAPAAPNAATADVTAQSLSTGCADAVPEKIDVNGKRIPLAASEGGSLTDQQVLQRLAERRAELDKRESDLNAREAIVAAAEKQMQQRADDLKALEAQINALADQKKQAEDAQFASLVSMYETMKPQDAGPIFNGLDLPVLVRVAKAMNPKKMALVLARMTP